ncbi:D-alanyl-D-alanine carboxypeptidase family protein [uncultured Adlercreutzia sp.]|uniref:D-alanyl-D-alanine carboxypeptidase family protein n=2 Tax=uncultured Adlercreutzia sp. TaxID=875803 RepID=UPI002604469F|nr:D-alanyl-D-alanine carboxypeptidase family protein [uncultured Adlercreutzia sp.]
MHNNVSLPVGSACERTGLRTRALACFWALLCALALAVSLAPAAWAEVRSTDELLGQTVEQRGLPAVACPNVTAQYALLMDDKGTVYFSREANERTHIASITKVMTAIVALENASLEDTVTVTAEAAQVGESTASLAAGDTLTMKAALTGLMVSSGNDAAIAIADTVGAALKTSDDQSNNEAFVAAMNAKAAELGMNDTLFANPHGLDIGNYDNEMYSTAHDVALMCQHAMENETFRDIVAQEKAQITVKRGKEALVINLTSTDLLLGRYEGACGIKTGYTEQAGQSFAGACQRDGSYLYAIVLGAPSENGRFEDAEALFSWVYDNQIDYPLAHTSQTTTMTVDGTATEVPLIAEVPFTAWPDKRVKATFADPAASVEVFAPEGNVSQEFTYRELNGSVSVGDVVGTVNFYQNNQVIASQELVATEDAAAPDFLEGLGIWWDRLWQGLGGTAEVADPLVYNETPLIYSKSTTAPSAAEALAAGDDQADAGNDATEDDAENTANEADQSDNQAPADAGESN